MKEETEFEKLGKKISFEVPEGFFENISQRTLQEIKQRDLRNKRVLFLRIGAVAASLAILVSIAFFLTRSGVNDKGELTEQKKVESPQKFKIETPDKAPVDSKKVAEKTMHEKSIPVVQQDEKIDDVLPDLSEEDLLQLAALYKADPFNE